LLKWFASLSLGLALSGCFTTVPKMVDPLIGLGVSTTPVENVDIRAYKGGRLVLVLSENTRNMLVYQKVSQEELKNSLIMKTMVTADNTQRHIANVDPANIVLRPSLALKQHFKEIVVAADLAEAEKTASPIAAILDIQKTDDTYSVGVINQKVDFSWSASVFFLNTNGSKRILRQVTARKTGSVSGSGSEFGAAFGRLDADLREQMLAELESNLNRAFRP
jgi:hexokinase